MVDDIYGMDVQWLAVDRDGHLAVLTLAVIDPVGPIPDDYRDYGLLERVSKFVDSLPRVTDAVLMEPMIPTADYIGFAERGFFSYDWADVSRRTIDCVERYEIQTCPANPVNMSDIDIPGDISAVILRVNSEFSNCPRLKIL